MGGGAMRTAAKAAVFAGYRSNAARIGPTLTPAATASTVHVAGEGESTPLISSIPSEKPAAMVQWPAWDIEDWEFAGGKDEEAAAVSNRMLDPPPRLVFGPAPTLEEAKEATADLKEAIEKVYFSSGAVEDSVRVSRISDFDEGAVTLPSRPKHVFQAFSLLQGSPEAQSVVASLASDKNVWDAVMKNDMVMEFYKQHQSDVALEESTGENESPKGFSETVESPDKEASQGSAFFTDIMQNFKVKVSQMVSNISGFLQDFLGASSDVKHSKLGSEPCKSTSENYVSGLGASFIALTVAAIMIVLFKRGSTSPA